MSLPWPWAVVAGSLLRSDQLRRSFGQALDGVGLGPDEIPSDAAHCEAGYTLHRYGKAGSGRPPVLIIPAPIKRPYIFDLLAGVSVVRRFLEANMSVYILAWREAGPDDAGWGLSEYASSWIGAAVDAIRAEQTLKPTLVGHSLGGTFAAIFSALNPDRIRKLVLVEAPLRFGEHTGSLASVVSVSPSAWLFAKWLGGAPGSLLDIASVSADPEEFVLGPWLDRWMSALDPDAMAIHARVMRWSLDEFPVPPRLFAEVVELLYREDRFAKGELTLAGRPALPAALIGLPIAAIVDRQSRVVPSSSALAPLADPIVFHYQPEIGVGLQHVGPLVGRRAHKELWPQILSWIET